MEKVERGQDGSLATGERSREKEKVERSQDGSLATGEGSREKEKVERSQDGSLATGEGSQEREMVERSQDGSLATGRRSLPWMSKRRTSWASCSSSRPTSSRSQTPALVSIANGVLSSRCIVRRANSGLVHEWRTSARAAPTKGKSRETERMERSQEGSLATGEGSLEKEKVERSQDGSLATGEGSREREKVERSQDGSLATRRRSLPWTS